MSNKLVKHKPLKKKSNVNIIILDIFIILFTVLFIGIWTKIYINSTEINHLSETIVQGIDYYVEDITIVKKDYDSSYPGDSSVSSENYYLFYGNAWEDKLFVDKNTYEEYDVGDKIPAYTEDHVNYTFTLRGLINQKSKYQNNEMHKATGVGLGCLICLMLMYRWIWKLTK